MSDNSMLNTGAPVRTAQNVNVSGIACALPGTVSRVIDLADRFGEENITKIISSTGVEQRHVVADECASDLCVKAAEQLILDMAIDKASIDTLIFVSQTPDYTLPATACTLQQRLGLPISTAAFDVALGCSGYVYGLWLASTLISGGGSRRVLLLVGDTISKLVAEGDRAVAALFGDAGSATLLDFDSEVPEIPFILGTDGRGEKNLIVPAGGFRDRQGQDLSSSEEGVRGPFDLYMNGAEVFAFTLARIPSLVKSLQSIATDKGQELDRYVFHQANTFMLEHLAKKIKLPAEKVLLNIKNVGNTSGASIPLALCLSHDPATGLTGNYLLAGFGVGYSWAGCNVQFSNTWISPLVFTHDQGSGAQ